MQTGELMVKLRLASPGQKRIDPTKEGEVSPLSPEYFLGTVFLLAGGIILPIIAFICELLNAVRIKHKFNMY